MSFITDLFSLVTKIAPVLADGLLGPAGGMVVSLIEKAFGVKGTDLLTTLADPSSAVTLKQLEYEHSEALQSLHNNDAANARDREISYTKETGKHDWVISLFAVTFLFGFFVFIFMTLFELLPSSTQTHSIFDILSNILCMICSYYFGSCHPANR